MAQSDRDELAEAERDLASTAMGPRRGRSIFELHDAAPRAYPELLDNERPHAALQALNHIADRLPDYFPWRFIRQSRSEESCRWSAGSWTLRLFEQPLEDEPFAPFLAPAPPVLRTRLEEAKRGAAREPRNCVDSMDWEKHQRARGDPDPTAPGRIRTVHDFSREDSLKAVSRCEMNRTADKGSVFSSLRPNGVNFVGLGERDKALDSRKVQDYFALPRDREERRDYRIGYSFDQAAGESRCFALCDDCSGGTWKIEGKDPFHRRGGGQQGVIILGGEHFTARAEGNRILAYNRHNRQTDRIPMSPEDPRYRQEVRAYFLLRRAGRGRD